MRCCVLVLLLVACCLLVTAPLSAKSPAAPPAFAVAKHAVLGGEGWWDYVTYDPAFHRLYLARADRVMVVDSETLKQVATIPDTPGVHGVALAPELKRGFISAGGANQVVAFDQDSLKEIKRIPTGERPDAILYDPATRRVFTFNARGQSTTAIDAASMTPIGDLALGGKPEAPAADGQGDIYVNIEDKSEMSEFDGRTLKELARWSLAPCEEPSGLAIDTAHHLLFSVCQNKLMAISDTDAKKMIATVPIGEGPDGAAFDPKLQLAFSSNGRSGNLTVVHEDSPSKFTVVQTVDTALGARTNALDPKEHRLFLITADIKMENGKRAMAPNSFQVLEVAPKK
jgi:DNA-binding beta-propeller fold protein YncE